MSALERHLVPFAAAPPGAPFDVLARLRRRPDRLEFRLAITGPGLAVPPADPAAPGRRDGLWRRTCAELFIGVVGEPGYLEWNLSPSGHWNLYRFDGYREGMRAEPAVTAAAPRVTRHGNGVIIESSLPLAALGLATAELEAGPCAVVETAGGSLSHWASAHQAEQPDFHDRRGFTVRLESAPGGAPTPGGSRDGLP